MFKNSERVFKWDEDLNLSWKKKAVQIETSPASKETEMRQEKLLHRKHFDPGLKL